MLCSLHSLELSLRYAGHLEWWDEAASSNTCLDRSRDCPWCRWYRNTAGSAVLPGHGKLPWDIEASSIVELVGGGDLRRGLGNRDGTRGARHLTGLGLLLLLSC